MSTVERTSHRTAPDRHRPQGRLARRLAGPGWVIMTLACVYIAVIRVAVPDVRPRGLLPRAAGALPPSTSLPSACMCSAACSPC